MAAVSSTMPTLGVKAPDFCLLDVSTGEKVTLSDRQGEPVLLMFICNHCPFVVHLIEPLVALANQAQKDGFLVAAISSNDVEHYPQDSPMQMKVFAKQYSFDFPYLYDETQEVAKLYKAACTPDFFVYDSEHRLQYRGQMDGSRPTNQLPITGEDLINAVTAIKNGREVVETQTPSIGCNIKWKQGNEPTYF